MKNLKGYFLILPLSLTLICATEAQQLKVPAPSPMQTLDQAFALSNIKIEYSRPSVKNRVVFGDLVPYGKLWRTGANASTKFTFGEDVKVEGKEISAGTYAVYSIPNKDSWDIMFYSDLKLGGNVSEYKKENEVARFTVKPSAYPVKVETFTINVSDIAMNSANIEFVWENTRVVLNVVADIDSKISKNIESVMSPEDKRPYYQAASYYYESGKDLGKALEWASKAVEQNPKAYWVAHLKAKIQLKQKDFKGAVASAEQSMNLAKEAGDDNYVKLNEKLIAEAKKGK